MPKQTITPFYRPLLKIAWRISTSSYVMWPLALLASLVGIAGTFQILFDVSSLSLDDAAIISALSETDFITGTVLGWSQAFDTIPWASVTLADAPILAAFFGILVIILFATVIIVSAEGGLIDAAARLIGKRPTTFLGSFRRGLDKFWELFLIIIIYRLLYLIIGALIVAPLGFVLIEIASGPRLLLAMLLYLIIIPLLIIFDLVTRYSMIYVVTDNAHIADAFSSAWLLFRVNWIISIETSLILGAVLFAGFLVLTMLILPLTALLFTMFGAMVSFSPIALNLAVMAALAVFVLIVAFAMTVFTAFQNALWVGVFQKLTSRDKHHSKIHRLTFHMPWLHRKVI